IPLYSRSETDCEHKNVKTNRDTLGSIYVKRNNFDMNYDYCTIDRLSYCKNLTASKQSTRTALDF
ncbi:hypothetical protein BgiMline_031652, partial [Biomphalaria glabrata]